MFAVVFVTGPATVKPNDFAGLLAVVGQQMDYLNKAMKVLSSPSENQYGIRGQPKYDKVCAAFVQLLKLG